MNFLKLVDWIKLSPKYLLGIFLTSGLILILDNTYLNYLGINRIAILYKTWIGIIFLISFVFLFVHISYHLSNIIKEQFEEWNLDKNRKNRLKKLTPIEKSILLGYFENNTRTQKLKITDGSVRELEMFQIIYRASELGSSGGSFSYNIQPWAWDYLNKNKKLLTN